MTRGKEYYQKQILDAAPVTVFTATNTAMLDYEYALGRPEECSPTLADACDIYIMDSGIGNNMETDEILSEALDVGADIVVPKDVIGDTAKTTTNTIEMLKAAAEHDIRVMVPLQSDEHIGRVEHFYEQKREMAKAGFTIEDTWVALGGIRDYTVAEQIGTAKYVRSRVGDDIHLHAFGCGMSHDWTIAIRKDPSLIDSLDSSSIRQMVGNGKLLNSKMNQVDFGLSRGKNSTCINAQVRESQLYMFNHLIGPFADERDVPKEFQADELAELFSE